MDREKTVSKGFSLSVRQEFRLGGKAQVIGRNRQSQLRVKTADLNSNELLKIVAELLKLSCPFEQLVLEGHRRHRMWSRQFFRLLVDSTFRCVL